MKQEDKQYEKWLAEVKSRQPILDNPEELTAAILNKITDNAPKKKKDKISRWCFSNQRPRDYKSRALAN